MTTLGRSGESSLTNPVLVFYAQKDGLLTTPYSLKYQIFDRTTEGKQLAPVQVYPVTVGNKADVDLTAHKIGAGQFVALYTVPGNATVGKYAIRWFWQWEQDGPEFKAEQYFEVITTAPPFFGRLYAEVADLREEGFASGVLPDLRALTSIALASRLVEAFTNRVFQPYYSELLEDGRGNTAVLLRQPIIGLEEFSFDTSPLFPTSIALTTDLYKVYNRHLRGMVTPDDREDPRIEVYNRDGGVFANRLTHYVRVVIPRGQQNVTVKGVFGYTDPDGTPFGRTPLLITHAVKLLARREMYKMSDCDNWEDAHRRWRLTSERTKEQSYTLDSRNPNYGAFTGDSEIDQILAFYCRPPALGAA